MKVLADRQSDRPRYPYIARARMTVWQEQPDYGRLYARARMCVTLAAFVAAAFARGIRPTRKTRS